MIHGNHHVQRAIQIAASMPNPRIVFLGAEEDQHRQAEQFANSVNEKLQVVGLHGCPCGHYTSKAIACICSPQEIKEHRIILRHFFNYPIWVKLERPDFEQITWFSKHKTVEPEIIKGKLLSIDDLEIGGNHLKLLETAYIQFQLSITDLENIINVAQVIAQLNKSDIHEYHLAEAITYCSRVVVWGINYDKKK